MSSIRNDAAVKQSGYSFRHVKERDWHELLKNRAELVLDDGRRETYDALPIRNTLKQSLGCKIMCKASALLAR